MDNKQNSKGRRINYVVNDIETENSRPIYETRSDRVAGDSKRVGREETTREINTEGKSKGLDNSSFVLVNNDGKKIDSKQFPDNPLHFKSQNDFNIWEQELARELDIRKKE